MVKIAVFEGESKAVFKDRHEFAGSLFTQLDEAVSFIDRYNSTRSKIEDLRRVDELNYLPEVVRKVLLNTFVRRDYAFSGPALISIFGDRMEFVTLGGLVKGITLSDLEEALGVGTTTANRVIKSLEEKGYIEQVGQGRSTRYRLK